MTDRFKKQFLATTKLRPTEMSTICCAPISATAFGCPLSNRNKQRLDIYCNNWKGRLNDILFKERLCHIRMNDDALAKATVIYYVLF